MLKFIGFLTIWRAWKHLWIRLITQNYIRNRYVTWLECSTNQVFPKSFQWRNKFMFFGVFFWPLVVFLILIFPCRWVCNLRKLWNSQNFRKYVWLHVWEVLHELLFEYKFAKFGFLTDKDSLNLSIHLHTVWFILDNLL